MPTAKSKGGSLMKETYIGQFEAAKANHLDLP